MGKPSAPSEQKSTVYQSSLPEYARPYYTRLMQRAESETLQPYTRYPGARLAGFTPDEQTGFDMSRAYGTSGTSDPYNLAMGSLGMAQGVAGAETDFNYAPGAIRGDYAADINRFTDPGVAGSYMDPYIGNVLDAQTREIARQGDIGRQRIQSDAARAGAFGGYRQAIEESELQRNTDRLMADTRAKGYSAAYDRAADAFMADEQRREASRQFGAQYGQLADLEGGKLGLSAAIDSARTRLGAGEMYGNVAQSATGLAQLYDAIERGKIDQILGTGYQQRQLGQSALDIANQDFVNQRDYERQNIAFLSGILHGVPVNPQSEVITETAAPSGLSQMLGAGIGSVGLAGLS
jgi:hypothetical protein